MNAYVSKEQIGDLISLARTYNPKLQIKINTVVNRHNWDVDLQNLIQKCQPDRWKVLRVLPAISHEHVITDEQFAHFLKRHADFDGVMSVEDNDVMQGSYIMIDPHARFFQNSPMGWCEGGYRYSDPIDVVGVDKAFNQIDFSIFGFAGRYRKAREVVAA